MNAMTKVLDEVKFRIPRDILILTFGNNDNSGMSIDGNMMRSVLRPRVMVDLNLASQETLSVRLNQCELVHGDDYRTVIRVPKKITNNRSIISVLHMMDIYLTQPATNSLYNENQGSSILATSRTMMGNLDNIDIRQTARLDLIGDNTILINEGNMYGLDMIIKVVVENDDNLNNIHPKTYSVLSHLAVLAVKAYIYNTLVVNLNKGYVYGGHDLSVIKDIVDTYSVSDLEYLDFLNNKWRKVAFMQNSINMDNYVTSLLGNNI